MNEQKHKIGLALSGASSRSVFYVGFLEAMNEAGVAFDYIAACSGATIIAGSYAAGTMDLLKQRLLTMERKSFFDLLEYSEGPAGVYNLDRFEEVLRFYTKGLRFEDLPFGMGFIAADIESGKQVVLHMGDIARAARISCTLPGVCEPVTWGSKLLVDGGLVSIVPGDVARDNGCDFVVGIDMRGNRHIFSKMQMRIKEALNEIRKNFVVSHTVRLWQRAYGTALTLVSDYYADYEEVDDRLNERSLFSVVNRALDIAIEAQNHPELQKPPYGCDLLVVPELPKGHLMKRYMSMVDFSNAQELYDLGREVGRVKAGEIKKVVR